jgi:NADH dehydrogenase (ubiquinone) Fe-S protein 1
MCLVEVERAPKPVASCAWPVQPGMVVKTDSPLTHKAREGVMEFLLANHPLDCPICDQGGECDLQDQSMRYGADRGRFHEISGKRGVEDKNIGPLVKTSMNRCIHCTRCVRFANDVAGAPELGSTGRGNDMQIGTYLEKVLDTELSGNVIDLCPVGALTSKPYAFRARPWELQHTETIDVLDALGSNIRVDARGMEVMRILPRLNDDVNEEWINDKTRFACDGLKTQRLTTPLIRSEGAFAPASWEQALSEIGKTYQKLVPKNNEFKVIAGQLVETESLVAMKDLANRLGSDNLALDQPGGSEPIAHGVDVRSNYLFNSKIYGVEEADAMLLVGTNPRHEAAVLNARIRKQWLRSDLEVGLVGETFDSTFGFEHLGADAAAVKSVLSGDFGKRLSSAKKPMIIVGSAVTEYADARPIFEAIGAFVDKNAAKFITSDWKGYNVLQRDASRAGAYEVGFTVPSPDVAKVQPKIIWLLGADNFSEADIPNDAFVIYQGHHGDAGAQIADVILPGATYTEKSGTYINTEGRCQITRAAVSMPGAARDDWKIIRAVSEYLGQPLPYDDIEALRDRMEEISPVLRRYDLVEPSSLDSLSKVQLMDQNKGVKATGAPLKKPIENFFFTDVISRRYSCPKSLAIILLLIPFAPARLPWHGAQQPRQLATRRPTLWLKASRTHKPPTDDTTISPFVLHSSPLACAHCMQENWLRAATLQRAERRALKLVHKLRFNKNICINFSTQFSIYSESRLLQCKRQMATEWHFCY